jgi:HlyD family secretion protein
LNNIKAENSPDLERILASGKEGKRGYLKHLVVWPILLLMIFFVWYKLFSDKNGSATEYMTMAAQKGDLTVTVAATGNLEPTNQVDVGTEVSGTVASVEVDFNDRVKAGQVLARLDTTMLAAQVKQSRSALDSSRSNLLLGQASRRQAKSEMERLVRVRELSGGKIPSKQDFDAADAALKRAEATVAMAKANIAQAEAKLRIDQTNLKKATIISPINGMVLKRSVEKGQTVAASLQAPVLFTLAEDLTKMELHVLVDEADVGKVQEGQEATFTVDAYPDRTFPASITQVRYGSQVTEGVVSYLTVLDVDNSDLSLRPGMTATANIVVQQVKSALLVPNAALRYIPPPKEEKSVGTQGGSLLSKLFPRPRHLRSQKSAQKGNRKQQQVWTLKNHQPVPVRVTTGATSGIMTEITSGDITPGMPLIVETISKSE